MTHPGKGDRKFDHVAIGILIVADIAVEAGGQRKIMDGSLKGKLADDEKESNR